MAAKAFIILVLELLKNAPVGNHLTLHKNCRLKANFSRYHWGIFERKLFFILIKVKDLKQKLK